MICVFPAFFGGTSETAISSSNSGETNNERTPISSSNGPISKALAFLKSTQQSDGEISNFVTSSWAVMAIAAAGEDPDEWSADGGASIVEYLIANRDMVNTIKALDIARFILAITASDEDPRNISGTDYVRILKDLFVDGQIGTYAWLNDDFWGVQALISAGEAANSTVVHESVEFIKENQNVDGGWGWGIYSSSDVDDTAAAVMALVSAGEANSSAVVQNAMQYLKDNQQTNGGFASWGEVNSASDSWAVGAICSVGQDAAQWEANGANVIENLLTFQNADGSFNWTRNDLPEWNIDRAWYTSYAIVALCLRQYPVNGLLIYTRIEGSESVIWSREVFVASSIIVDDDGQEHYLTEPVVLGALDKAAEIGGFNYKVHRIGCSLSLYSVAGDKAVAPKMWLYQVDNVEPEMGLDMFVWNVTSPPQPPHRRLLFFISSCEGAGGSRSRRSLLQ